MSQLPLTEVWVDVQRKGFLVAAGAGVLSVPRAGVECYRG